MKAFFITLLALASWTVALAWGQKGHDVTAHIAERHLTPTTQAAIDSILDGRSIVYWANWLDNASHTDEYAYTKTWHYKNIDEGQDYYEVEAIPTGNVITAITEQIGALSSDTLSKDEAALALKILVHLVGDLHQPMHMGHLSDLGGNTIKINLFNNPRNLHSLWDEPMVGQVHAWSYTEWADQLDRLSQEQIDQIVEGTLDNWGEGTFKIAQEIYDETPEGYKVSYDYLAKWAPTVEDQLLLGGLRLGYILNNIFDPQQ